MFKAKLIEDPTYYRLRRRLLLLAFLPVLPVALIANYYNLPLWIPIGALVIEAGVIWWTFRNQRALEAATGNRSIEIDEQSIRLLDGKGNTVESYDLTQADRLLLKKEYGIPEENLSDLTRELKGEPKRNFLILEQAGQRRQFDFVVDSYYGLTQLNKLIDRWTAGAYPVERV